MKKLNEIRYALPGIIGGSLLAIMMGANSASATVNADVYSAMQSIKTETFDTINAVAPIAITIFGIFLAWRYGKKIFRSVAK